MSSEEKRCKVEAVLEEAIKTNDQPRARYLEQVLSLADDYSEDDPIKEELLLDHPFRSEKRSK